MGGASATVRARAQGARLRANGRARCSAHYVASRDAFWLVSALSEIGQKARAKAVCERMLSLASPLGLYGEEIEAESGRHLGNFPQALTHLALIDAVQHDRRRIGMT